LECLSDSVTLLGLARPMQAAIKGDAANWGLETSSDLIEGL
jgi:hypothetical protein